MTNEAILEAALKVWAKDFYQTTSLQSVARALRVTKPALYRHFRSKDALLAAMRQSYYDRLALCNRLSVCAEAVEGGDVCANGGGNEREVQISLSIAEFFLRNKDYFIFLIMHLFSIDGETGFKSELAKRGITLANNQNGEYPALEQLISVSSLFMICYFYKQKERAKKESYKEDYIENYLKEIEDKARRGLDLWKDEIKNIDYKKLEDAASCCPVREVNDDTREKIIGAVLSSLAEAGTAHISMEMVARKTGISKSSLYSHFKNKSEMIKESIETEFERVIFHARECSRLSVLSYERLYLAITGIKYYLKAKPAVLCALNKLRMEKAKYKKRPHSEKDKAGVVGIFSNITNDDGSPLINARDTEWILFLIVNVLLGNCKKDIQCIEDKSFRILFKFITGGIEKC